jgi:hypothetical protein
MRIVVSDVLLDDWKENGDTFVQDDVSGDTFVQDDVSGDRLECTECFLCKKSFVIWKKYYDAFVRCICKPCFDSGKPTVLLVSSS